MYYLKTSNLLNRSTYNKNILRLYSAFYNKTTQKALDKTSKTSSKIIPNVVLIDAVRTPFAVSNTVYGKLMAVNLQRHALKGTLKKFYIAIFKHIFVFYKFFQKNFYKRKFLIFLN